jgi:hypothetical protein
MTRLKNKLTTATPSKVTKAATNSQSLRATIPSDIAKALKLDPGDLIIWSLDDMKNKKIAIVEKWERE